MNNEAAPSDKKTERQMVFCDIDYAGTAPYQVRHTISNPLYVFTGCHEEEEQGVGFVTSDLCEMAISTNSYQDICDYPVSQYDVEWSASDYARLKKNRQIEHGYFITHNQWASTNGFNYAERVLK